MSLTIGVVLAIFALAGASLGWHKGTNAINRRTVEDYERAHLRSRKRSRPLVTATYGVVGAALGYVLMLALAFRS